MNYALIENGIVINIISLHPMNAEDFPNAIPIDRYPVAIGDTYDGEFFYRNGEKVQTILDGQEDIINEYRLALNVLTGEQQLEEE